MRQKFFFFAAMAMLVAAIVLGPDLMVGVAQTGFAGVGSRWINGALDFHGQSGVSQFTISPTGPVRVRTRFQIQLMRTTAGETGELYNDAGTVKVSP